MPFKSIISARCNRECGAWVGWWVRAERASGGGCAQDEREAYYS